MVIPKSSNVGN